MKIANELYIALNELEKHGYEAYLVGGAVRDLLLNRDNADYDITTSADPNAIAMVFHDYQTYNTGKKHGTLTVLINGLKIEITPYRKETDYTDHRHPDSVEFSGSLQDDLQRRDFTINALCMDARGNIIDLYGGIDDLNARLIRAIGDPKARFNEDALRIWRALRFKAKLGFDIEEKTDRELFECAGLLKYISLERKRNELLQMLAYPNSFSIIADHYPIVREYLPVARPERKINDFEEPLFALAYLLKDQDRIDLKKYKFSAQEDDLVNSLIAASRIDIADDTAFIKCLSSLHRQEKLRFLERYHHIDLKERYEKLKRFMVDINELQIDGDTIASFGYSGKQIGQVKAKLCGLIHQQKLDNTCRSLRDHLQKNIL